MAKIGEDMARQQLLRGGVEFSQALKALPDSIPIVDPHSQVLNGSAPEHSQEHGDNASVDPIRERQAALQQQVVNAPEQAKSPEIGH